MRMMLATLLATAALAPAVTTGPAETVGQTTATLTGTVDPNGTATTYHFDYGATTAYGLKTVDLSAGAGDDAVTFKLPVDKLTPSTTYHYRLVAGETNGNDVTFKTAAAPINPTIPGISRLSAVDKTATSARLTARINPHRAITTWHVEWGGWASLGRRTLDQSIAAGTKDIAISTALSGLTPNRRVYWRVVANNAAGVKRSGTASFTTLRAPSGLTLTLTPGTAAWNGLVSVRGNVAGSGVSGIRIVLQAVGFPFTAPFADVATATADSRGDFAFAARPVFLATRYRALIRSPATGPSNTIVALVRPRVGIRRSLKTRRAVLLSGTVNPGLPAGRATLQRRSRAGGWSLVRRQALRAVDATHSTYVFRVKRRKRAAAYRVVIAPQDANAHVPARSRAVTIGKRRR
jgi:hypothetical protein